MNADIIVGGVIALLQDRFGKPQQSGRARILTFGDALTCSINYSKQLRGEKYFFAVPRAMLDPQSDLPKTQFGEFVLLICGLAQNVLVLPRALMLHMMSGVPTRRVDVFYEDRAYILQTTRHPKVDVTKYINAFPATDQVLPRSKDSRGSSSGTTRAHVKVQWGLTVLGRAEGCDVWVPKRDRGLSYGRRPLSAQTIERLPNFGFEENTRRIVQNIDVLWLSRNVFQGAFEIEATTSIYSGLLRLNDLVLAQPNIRVELYLAAPRARRGRVHGQLMRPSFRSLLTKCAFITFEEVDRLVKQVEDLEIDRGTRISGLIRGERFEMPEGFAYPVDLD